MINDISLTSILKADPFLQNPTINFLCDEYDPEYRINYRGETIAMKDVAFEPSIPSLSGDLNKRKSLIVAKNLISLFAFVALLSMVGSVIRVSFEVRLIDYPNYWKFILLEFSYLLTCLNGFADLITWRCSRQKRAKRCIINSSMIDSSRLALCSFTTTIRDVCYILSKENPSCFEEQLLPYSRRYFNNVAGIISSLEPSIDIHEEYSFQQGKIACTSSLLRIVFVLLIGLAIQVFTFLDLREALQKFITNLFLLAFAIPAFSFGITRFFVLRKFKTVCDKLDALLYVYSYQYLDMPFGPERIIDTEIEIEQSGAADEQAVLEYWAHQLSKTCRRHICVRHLIVQEGRIKLLTNCPVLG